MLGRLARLALLALAPLALVQGGCSLLFSPSPVAGEEDASVSLDADTKEADANRELIQTCLPTPSSGAGLRYCFGGNDDVVNQFSPVDAMTPHLTFDQPVTVGPSYIEISQNGRGLIMADTIFEALVEGETLSVELILDDGALPVTNGFAPQRILALETVLSDGTDENFMVGTSSIDGCAQRGSRLLLRSGDDASACFSSLNSEVSSQPQYVAATLNGNQVALYINGQSVLLLPGANNRFTGPSDWAPGTPFVAVANRVGGNRAWQGRIHFIGIYPQELTAEEIQDRAAMLLAQ